MCLHRQAIFVCLLLASLVAVPAGQATGIADVRVGDLVIGESHQSIGPIRLTSFPDDAGELTLRIDLSVLKDHGVGIDGASVTLTDDRLRGGTLTTAAVRDGVLLIVVEPTDDALLLEPFKLTGLATAGAEPRSDLRYVANFSAGEARTDSFDLVDPAEVTPRIDPNGLILDEGTHSVHIEGLLPAGGDVTVTLDVSTLEGVGVDLGELRATATADGATVVETRVHDGNVTVIASPAAEAALIDIEVTLIGLEARTVGTGSRVLAQDVRYEVRIQGAAERGAGVALFDIYRRGPSPHVDEEIVTDEGARGGVAVETDGQPGFGPAMSALVLLAVAGLAVRRS